MHFYIPPALTNGMKNRNTCEENSSLSCFVCKSLFDRVSYVLYLPLGKRFGPSRKFPEASLAEVRTRAPDGTTKAEKKAPNPPDILLCSRRHNQEIIQVLPVLSANFRCCEHITLTVSPAKLTTLGTDPLRRRRWPTAKHGRMQAFIKRVGTSL